MIVLAHKLPIKFTTCKHLYSTYQLAVMWNCSGNVIRCQQTAIIPLFAAILTASIPTECSTAVFKTACIVKSAAEVPAPLPHLAVSIKAHLNSHLDDWKHSNGRIPSYKETCFAFLLTHACDGAAALNDVIKYFVILIVSFYIKITKKNINIFKKMVRGLSE